MDYVILDKRTELTGAEADEVSNQLCKFIRLHHYVSSKGDWDAFLKTQEGKAANRKFEQYFMVAVDSNFTEHGPVYAAALQASWDKFGTKGQCPKDINLPSGTFAIYGTPSEIADFKELIRRELEADQLGNKQVDTRKNVEAPLVADG